MPAPRTDVAYSGYNPRYITHVRINTRPHRFYLTAERALNKDEFGQVLWWNTEYHNIFHDVPRGSNYKIDERGEVVLVYLSGNQPYERPIGWLRIDELNEPLNVVPLKYYTVQKRDLGRDFTDIMIEQGVSGLHADPSLFKLIKLWNQKGNIIFQNSIVDNNVGKTFIIDMGFPPTSDANLFRNEQLENNRYQNASQSQMVSVKLQGRPNTRYIAKTSAPRNPESNNHEVFIGLYPSEPNQSIGFSVNEDMVFITDHKGEIELSFYDSELSGVNADYLDFLDYTYWVEILVHPNQVMTVPPDMVLQSGEGSYEVFNGTNLESGLELKPGINEITIVGNGNISFHWNDEVMG